MNIAAPDTHSAAEAVTHIQARATALGVDLGPDSIMCTFGEKPATYDADVQVVPDEAVEASARALWDQADSVKAGFCPSWGKASQDPEFEHGVRLVRQDALVALEAAYTATRADQLRKFANELEAALETGDSPHQLPYDWRDDANLLDGAR